MVFNMCEWQRLRTKLNHDWLKNEYTKKLDGLIVQLQGRKKTNERLESYLNAYLSDWSSHHSDLKKLLFTIEKHLSPRTFFEQKPLSLISVEYSNWLIPITHSLWMTRNRIKETTQKAEELFVTADNQHALLQKASTAADTDVKLILESLEFFTDTVSELSKVIGLFPTKVIV